MPNADFFVVPPREETREAARARARAGGDRAFRAGCIDRTKARIRCSSPCPRPAGTIALNELLKRRLNPDGPRSNSMPKDCATRGTMVMQTCKRLPLEVFNGP